MLIQYSDYANSWKISESSSHSLIEKDLFNADGCLETRRHPVQSVSRVLLSQEQNQGREADQAPTIPILRKRGAILPLSRIRVVLN